MDDDRIALITQFVELTGSDPDRANHCLEAFGDNLEAAINFYLESGGIGYGNGTSPGLHQELPSSHQFARPRREAQPLAASDLPRSSPIEILNEDEDDDPEVRLVSSSFGAAAASGGNGRNETGSRRGTKCNRAVEDIIDDDWQPIDNDGDDDMEIVEASSDSDIEEEGGHLGRRGGSAHIRDTRRRQRRTRQRQPVNYRDPDNEDFVVHADGGMMTGTALGGHDAMHDDVTLPDDIDLEEQRMLMAAMTGQVYEGRIPNFDTDPRYRPRALSPGSQQRELLRQEQDFALAESLAADRRKEEEQARLEQEEQAQKREVEEAKERLENEIRRKRSLLPKEPEQGAADGVVLAIRMPSGKRIGRRFRQTDRLHSVFDFVDVVNHEQDSPEGGGAENGNEGILQPGSYNLVSQFPRRVFESDDERTLEEAGLGHTQEALFVQLK